jgi:acetyl esterase
LARINAQEAPPLHTLSAAEHRAQTVAQTQPSPALPAVAAITERTIPGPAGDVPATVYRPAGAGPFPLVLFFHGGGFVLPALPHHDHLCRALCNGAGCVVVAVDYRLSPEAPFPAATDDCMAATRWAAQHGALLEADRTRLAVAGDSSGGALAAVTALRCRDEGGPPLVAQVLLCPLTAYPMPPTPSGLAYARGYLLTRARLLWYLQQYVSATAAAHPYAFPLAAPDLRDLPPALIITAEYDILRDEGERYAARLRATRVPTTLARYPGMIHGFFAMPGLLAQAQQAIDESVHWLKTQFKP